MQLHQMSLIVQCYISIINPTLFIHSHCKKTKQNTTNLSTGYTNLNVFSLVLKLQCSAVQGFRAGFLHWPTPAPVPFAPSFLSHWPNIPWFLFQRNVAALPLSKQVVESQKRREKGFSYILQGNKFNRSHRVSNRRKKWIIRAPLCFWQVLCESLQLTAQQ